MIDLRHREWISWDCRGVMTEMRRRLPAVCAAVLLCAARVSGYQVAAIVPRSRPVRPALRCSLDVSETAEVEAPLRPRMAPGPTKLVPQGAEEHVESEALVEESHATHAAHGSEELVESHAMVEEDEPPPEPKVEVFMDKLKEMEDKDGGISAALGNVLNLIDKKGTLRRRLWTRADFMHIHAVTGAYFLAIGMPWLVYSHLTNAMDTSAYMATSSIFLTSLLLAGLLNALSAIPMSRFSSNKMFDIKDLKANGFTFGGTGLTTMCLWIAWWFSGSYPDWLHPFDKPIFALWTAVCVGTTVNWEYMLQQNFEANERAGRKFAKVSKEEMNKKAILYRLASWPNLTQLMFMWSIPAGARRATQPPPRRHARRVPAPSRSALRRAHPRSRTRRRHGVV